MLELLFNIVKIKKNLKNFFRQKMLILLTFLKKTHYDQQIFDFVLDLKQFLC